MYSQYPIAIIGGTGKSGQYLVKQLIAQGFSFKLLVRNPDKFPFEHKKIEVIKGDVTNEHAVRSLVEGCSGVISTLGLGMNSFLLKPMFERVRSLLMDNIY